MSNLLKSQIKFRICSIILISLVIGIVIEYTNGLKTDSNQISSNYNSFSSMADDGWKPIIRPTLPPNNFSFDQQNKKLQNQSKTNQTKQANSIEMLHVDQQKQRIKPSTQSEQRIKANIDQKQTTKRKPQNEIVLMASQHIHSQNNNPQKLQFLRNNIAKNQYLAKLQSVMNFPIKNRFKTTANANILSASSNRDEVQLASPQLLGSSYSFFIPGLTKASTIFHAPKLNNLFIPNVLPAAQSSVEITNHPASVELAYPAKLNLNEELLIPNKLRDTNGFIKPLFTAAVSKHNVLPQYIPDKKQFVFANNKLISKQVDYSLINPSEFQINRNNNEHHISNNNNNNQYQNNEVKVNNNKKLQNSEYHKYQNNEMKAANDFEQIHGHVKTKINRNQNFNADKLRNNEFNQIPIKSEFLSKQTMEKSEYTNHLVPPPFIKSNSKTQTQPSRQQIDKTFLKDDDNNKSNLKKSNVQVEITKEHFNIIQDDKNDQANFAQNYFTPNLKGAHTYEVTEQKYVDDITTQKIKFNNNNIFLPTPYRPNDTQRDEIFFNSYLTASTNPTKSTNYHTLSTNSYFDDNQQRQNLTKTYDHSLNSYSNIPDIPTNTYFDDIYEQEQNPTKATYESSLNVHSLPTKTYLTEQNYRQEDSTKHTTNLNHLLNVSPTKVYLDEKQEEKPVTVDPANFYQKEHTTTETIVKATKKRNRNSLRRKRPNSDKKIERTTLASSTERNSEYLEATESSLQYNEFNNRISNHKLDFETTTQQLLLLNNKHYPNKESKQQLQNQYLEDYIVHPEQTTQQIYEFETTTNYEDYKNIETTESIQKDIEQTQQAKKITNENDKEEEKKVFHKFRPIEKNHKQSDKMYFKNRVAAATESKGEEKENNSTKYKAMKNLNKNKQIDNTFEKGENEGDERTNDEDFYEKTRIENFKSNRYDPNHRPKFSVKDYRQKLLNTTTTTTEVITPNKFKFPSRDYKNRLNRTENTKERGFKQFTTSTEYYETTTEKRKTFRPTYNRRQNKFKEQTTTNEIEKSTTTTIPTNESTKSKLNSVFTKLKRPSSLSLRQKLINKRLNSTDDTTGSANENVQVAVKPDEKKYEEIDQSQRIADLTHQSAASQENIFKTLPTTSSRRVVPNYFTIATEDPILPIQAFFPKLSSKDNY